MLTQISHAQPDNALYVIRTVARDLQSRNIPLWDADTMTIDSLFGHYPAESIITGYIDNHPVTAMILITHDPTFWPEVAPGQSGFIHKLCVLPEYQGRGIAQQMIVYAEYHLIENDINTLRLDCDANRPKLCRIYENVGFIKVDNKTLGRYLVTRYLKILPGKPT